MTGVNRDEVVDGGRACRGSGRKRLRGVRNLLRAPEIQTMCNLSGPCNQSREPLATGFAGKSLKKENKQINREEDSSGVPRLRKGKV